LNAEKEKKKKRTKKARVEWISSVKKLKPYPALFKEEV